MCPLYKSTAHEESLEKIIVNCAFLVHNNLGPGLLEAVYEHCFCHELKKKNIKYARQVSVPLIYDGAIEFVIGDWSLVSG